MTNSNSKKKLSDTDAWGLAEILTAQVIYNARLLATREEGDPHKIAVDGVGEDLARAAMAWMLWDQGRRRPVHHHPGVAGLDPTRWPVALPSPRVISTYQTQLLAPLLTADPDRHHLVRVTLLALRLADQTTVSQGLDQPGGGKTLARAHIDGQLVVPDPSGWDRVASCPVCDRGTGLVVDWDGLAGTASCPRGHARWGLPTLSAHRWHTLVGAHPL